MRLSKALLAAALLASTAACSSGGGGAHLTPPSPANSAGSTTSSSALPSTSTESAAGTRSAQSTTGIGVVQTAYTHTASAATSISIQMPNTPAAGDLLVAAVAFPDARTTLNTPSGWSWVDNVSMNWIGQSTLYHIVASGESNNYTFTVNAPNGSIPLGVYVQEISGVNASSPIAAHTTTEGATGYSTTTGTLSASGALPLAFYAQFCNGNVPLNFTGNWSGRYTVNFGANYSFAQEGTYGSASSSSVNGLESWTGGDNSSQVSELVLINPGSSGGGTVTSSPPSSGSSGGSSSSPSIAASTSLTHVKTMAYYGANMVNAGIPASYMGAHVDFVEVDQASYAASFRANGGTYALLYTDPHLVPFCSSGSCTGPLGWVTPESAWLHDSNGNRLHTSSYQDALNPASSATQSAFNTYTSQQTSGTAINAIFVDDTEPSYIPSYWSYKFGAQAQEVVSQSNPDGYWAAGQRALMASSAEPVIYSGGEGDADDVALETAPNVIGHMIEECVVGADGRVNLTQGNPTETWGADLNKMLSTTNQGRYAVCMNYSVYGGNLQGDRMYAMASWWLTYDPNYSVMFPDFSTSDSAGGYSSQLFAEYSIVPTQPIQNPGSDVTNLRTSTGAYLREFAACYQNGNLIGHCAAVVNPNASGSVSMPSFTQSYSRSMTLDDHSSYNGGVAAWNGGVPSSLGAMTGIILLQ